MEPINAPESVGSPQPTQQRRARQAALALVLAGALGIIGVGTAFAQDSSASPSASPSASDGSGTTDSSTHDCPERATQSETTSPSG